MKKLLFAALLPLLAVTSTRAHAETAQRLEITTPSEVKRPDASAIVRSLVGEDAAASQTRVQVKLINADHGSTMQIDVTGATLPSDAADRVKAMFPALRDAQITLSTVQASPPPVEPGDLSTPEAIEAFREKLQKQLEAEGKTGTVKVLVEKKDDGQQKIRVEVTAAKTK